MESLTRRDARACSPQRQGLALLLALSACSFGGAQKNAQQNSCTVDTDCDSKHCEAGRCVTARSDTPLSVALEVIPKRLPDGSQPFPIVSDPFALQSGKVSFNLHMPKRVGVRVHDGDRIIAAQVSFQPQLATTYVASTTQITTNVPSEGESPGDVMDGLSLLQDVDYTVSVQPIDPSDPPLSQMLHVASDDTSDLDVDYSQITWQMHDFSVRNAPPGVYQVRAREKSSTRLVSNTVPVGDAGLVTLKIDPSSGPYALEFSPIDQSATSYTNDASSCDDPSVRAPTLSIDASVLPADKSQPNRSVVELPNVPDAFRYSGTIALCPNQKPGGSLPVSFQASSLTFGGSSKMFTGGFTTWTTADWNETSGQYEFCARLLSGDYVVVVTPASSMNCEIFAEKRLLSAPSDGSDISDASLELRTPASLSGTVVTPAGMPMANASIDLMALGTPGVTLAADDATVPTHNRSRIATSTANGGFAMALDIGTYDVVVKPPTQSNYAWRVIYGVDIGSRTPQFSTTIMLSEPVVVTGPVQYEGGDRNAQKTLASAEVHAFTVVDDKQPDARSIEIASGQVDSNGNVTLLLPSELQKSWVPQ